jgi:superfamily II DNA or RNA helicase
MTGSRAVSTPAAPATRWLPVDLDSARAFIARALLSPGSTREVPHALGDVTLLPHQRDAVVRLRKALARFRGALLADDVGLGKTYVALAVARDYGDAHVMAPAALLPMWRTSIERTASRHVTLHSLHACSTRAPRIPGPGAGRGLVIIDEAHHLRTATTRRYRAVADAVAAHDVLLLSATPIHNRPRELRALLALFMNARDDLLDPDMLARLIVRRGSDVVRPLVQASARPVPASASASAQGAYTVPHRPRICEHPPFQVPHDPATLTGILALPAPLPAHGGSAAGALVRLGLLRAWCSSDAAFDAALGRRLLRGSALRDALLAGRHPTNGELRAWVVGDSHDMQLAFPELMSANAARPALLPALGLHVDALSALRERHRNFAQGDAARAMYLRQTLGEHPGLSLIAFSQLSGTVRALYRALSDIAGVGMLTGSGARIASGRISRREMIARFAPHAQGLPPPPAHHAVRLLLATDLLAEGVNLQDAGVVVHLDLPWTDALRRQRVGRVARLGSARTEIHVHAIHPPDIGERALRQLERLRTKAAFSTRLVGGARPSSAADHESAWRATLQSWLRSDTEFDQQARLHAGACSMVAIAPARRRAAFALVQSDNEWHLLDCDPSTAPVTPGDATADISRGVQLLDAVATSPSAVVPGDLAALTLPAERFVARWLSTRRTREQAGALPRGLSAGQRRLLERIRTVRDAQPAIRRGAMVRAADEAIRIVHAAAGAACERALDAWLWSFASAEPADWLRGWMRWPALQAGVQAQRWSQCPANHSAPSDVGECPIRLLVLLEPPAGR